MEKIRFKPLNKGLGFHPFSDGLPYAPVTKAPQSPPTIMGTGAVAAGPARIVLPQKPRPIAKTIEPSKAETPHYGLIYLIHRTIAYSIDTGLNIVLCLGGLRLALWKMHVPFSKILTLETMFILILFLMILNWALIAAQEIAFGTTIGKRLFGLTLDGGAAVIFLRSFFFAISFCFMGAGLLWAIFDKNKKCWHDAAVNIQPEYITRL